MAKLTSTQAILTPTWRAARDRALALLLAGGRDVLITGPAGTGKTLLLHELARILRVAGWTATVRLYADSTAGELLVPGRDPSVRTAILVDEADRLPASTLDEIRINSATARVIAGLDTLRDRLPGYQLVSLAPLSSIECKTFVKLWLDQSGHPPGVLNAEATARIAEFSGGVPRVLVSLLNAALWLAETEGPAEVSKTIAQDAVAFRDRFAIPTGPVPPVAPSEADQRHAEPPPAISPETPIPPTAQAAPMPRTAQAAPMPRTAQVAPGADEWAPQRHPASAPAPAPAPQFASSWLAAADNDVNRAIAAGRLRRGSRMAAARTLIGRASQSRGVALALPVLAILGVEFALSTPLDRQAPETTEPFQTASLVPIAKAPGGSASSRLASTDLPPAATVEPVRALPAQAASLTPAPIASTTGSPAPVRPAPIAMALNSDIASASNVPSTGGQPDAMLMLAETDASAPPAPEHAHTAPIAAVAPSGAASSALPAVAAGLAAPSRAAERFASAVSAEPVRAPASPAAEEQKSEIAPPGGAAIQSLATPSLATQSLATQSLATAAGFAGPVVAPERPEPVAGLPVVPAPIATVPVAAIPVATSTGPSMPVAIARQATAASTSTMAPSWTTLPAALLTARTPSTSARPSPAASSFVPLSIGPISIIAAAATRAPAPSQMMLAQATPAPEPLATGASKPEMASWDDTPPEQPAVSEVTVVQTRDGTPAPDDARPLDARPLDTRPVVEITKPDSAASRVPAQQSPSPQAPTDAMAAPRPAAIPAEDATVLQPVASQSPAPDAAIAQTAIVPPGLVPSAAPDMTQRQPATGSPAATAEPIAKPEPAVVTEPAAKPATVANRPLLALPERPQADPSPSQPVVLRPPALQEAKPAPVAVAPPPAPLAETTASRQPAPPASAVAPQAARPAAQQAPGLPPPVVAMLMKRGNDMLAIGDVSGARLMFGKAAASGSSAAMTAMGRTFDPAVLSSIGPHLLPNPDMASDWYNRAATAGDGEAPDLLRQLQQRQPPQIKSK